MTLGSIDLDTKNFVAEIHREQTIGRQTSLQMRGLRYSYNACLDPSSVSFEVYQHDNQRHCDLTKSLDSVQIMGMPEARAADITLQIDGSKVNSDALGAAYSAVDGNVLISLCLRARVSRQTQELLFTEDTLEVKFSTQTDFSSGPIKLDSFDNAVTQLEFSFEGDYAAIIGNRKDLFLHECTESLKSGGLNVYCVYARPGSIIVTLGGEQDELEKAESHVQAKGLNLESFVHLKFTNTIQSTILILSNVTTITTEKVVNGINTRNTDPSLILVFVPFVGVIVSVLAVAVIILCIRKNAQKRTTHAGSDPEMGIELPNY